MHKVLSTDYNYIETIQKRNLEFRIPRLQRVLNRSDLRSKLGRIEYTKIHYGTAVRGTGGVMGLYGVYPFLVLKLGLHLYEQPARVSSSENSW